MTGWARPSNWLLTISLSSHIPPDVDKTIGAVYAFHGPVLRSFYCWTCFSSASLMASVHTRWRSKNLILRSFIHIFLRLAASFIPKYLKARPSTNLFGRLRCFDAPRKLQTRATISMGWYRQSTDQNYIIILSLFCI